MTSTSCFGKPKVVSSVAKRLLDESLTSDGETTWNATSKRRGSRLDWTWTYGHVSCVADEPKKTSKRVTPKKASKRKGLRRESNAGPLAIRIGMNPKQESYL